MANLTLQSKLVTKLPSVKTQPGLHLVVLRDSARGRKHYRTFKSGSEARIPILDRWRFGFLGYAVAAGSDLRHRFNTELVTGSGSVQGDFGVSTTVRYQIGAASKLVERIDEDPLQCLENEIRDALERRASMLSFANLTSPEFDVESFLLSSDHRGAKQGDSSTRSERPARFSRFASGFGINLDRVEFTWTHSSERTKIGQKTLLALKQAEGDNQLAEAGTKGVGKTEILKSLVASTQRVIANISKDIDGPDDLAKLAGKLEGIRDDFERLLKPGSRVELPPATKLSGVGASGGGLGGELRVMLEMVEELPFTEDQKAGLYGRILHVLGDLTSGGQDGPGELEEHAEELGRYCREIDLAAVLSSEEQRRYFGQFRSVHSARQVFGEVVESATASEGRGG